MPDSQHPVDAVAQLIAMPAADGTAQVEKKRAEFGQDVTCVRAIEQGGRKESRGIGRQVGDALRNAPGV